jgi:hypothetical protein
MLRVNQSELSAPPKNIHFIYITLAFKLVWSKKFCFGSRESNSWERIYMTLGLLGK